MRGIRCLVLALALAGCSGATGPAEPESLPAAGSGLRLVNATSRPFAYFVFAADLAPLLDPIPEVVLTESHIDLIAAGEAQPLGEVPGREQAPEGGVAVFLYTLTPDGLRARFAGVELVSGDDIQRAGRRIVISRVEG